jgi:hypothetical protein
MRFAVVLALLFVASCGKEIGDACQSDEGYCTIQGCDYSTCPEESVCVRFFTGFFENKDCESNTDCSLDELCSLKKKCVPRSSEVRYCMRNCGSPDDCRDGYECRTFELMKDHGGEPVLEPGVEVDESAPNFCALKP